MAVTVGVTTQAKDAAQALAAPVMSRRILSEPTDVSVSASILGTEKSGQDLVVRLSNGETLNIENFFVIGPNGDFSRLLSADGSPVVTGLMAPEPDLAQDTEFTEAMQTTEGVTPVSSGSSDIESADAGGAGDWGDTALFAGAGFSLGSGIGYLSDDESTPAPVAQNTQPDNQTDLATAIEELTGPEDMILEPSDFDPEAADTPPSEDAEAASSEFSGENATELPETSGFLVSDSPDPSLLYIPEAQDGLFTELMTEIT
ncbi:BapA/Bap/LapF family prefix-like domain-containing protein [Pseudosulfitobacter pseudonitzschiae]|nr:hypothetical protein [Pseudosulfitobacter pseudonitzschiae]MBM1813676.1 hypothetical protein [Pseudosulfitobacter pseudonitzschiae]MBM1830669.1 hypothetical protein [Pseudosulfitobacter pseudonitzschiae]MBM1850470.1 hypothetical protein [Pseudosulfitobacter pseudonitzschiae]MBM1855308.1 hypothetical protein [Pseudosulfitobacter pseudonitzschiae]MBM1860168.1 hypothetical protein [Pseudosulfitobacter pseudonitzschiae]